MNRMSTLLLAAAVISLPACRQETAQQRAERETGAPPTTETYPSGTMPPTATTPSATMPTAGQPIMTAPVRPVGNSKVTGEVQIMPVAANPNAFMVMADFKNLPKGEHAWHIHQGKCSAPNTPVVVAFTAMPDKPAIGQPLMADSAGTAMGEVSVPANVLTVEQLRSGEYSLNVRLQGGTNPGPSIGCADL